MARRRLRDAIVFGLPRTVRIVGEPAIDAQIELFLEHRPATWFLYRVPAEFGRWAVQNNPEWPANARDALWVDIEVLAVANAQSRLPEHAEPSLQMDNPVHVTHARALIEIAPDSEFAVPGAHHLALFRSELDQRVYMRALSVLQASFLRAIVAGRTPRQASQQAVSEASPEAAPTESDVAQIADVITEWIEHRVWFARELP
jgi:hypothetical protein